MKTYNDLLIDCEKNNINVKEINFTKYNLNKKCKGLYKNNKIAINSELDTVTEKKCVLSEEMGHHYTSHGNIIDTSNLCCIKQEILARRWGYKNVVSPRDLILAYCSYAKYDWEIAEFCDVTVEYLHELISSYKCQYGVYLKVDNYLLIFEPYLSVLKSTS